MQLFSTSPFLLPPCVGFAGKRNEGGFLAAVAGCGAAEYIWVSFKFQPPLNSNHPAPVGHPSLVRGGVLLICGGRSGDRRSLGFAFGEEGLNFFEGGAVDEAAHVGVGADDAALIVGDEGGREAA